MRRHLLPLVFAVASMAGCLSQFGGTYGPDPGSGSSSGSSPGQPSQNGNRGGGGSGGGGGGGTGSPDPGTGSSTGGGAVDMGQAAAPVDLAGPVAQSGSIAITPSTTSEALRLNDSKQIMLTVAPSNGFNGMVTFSLAGAPTGVTATFQPPGMMISTQTSVVMTLKTASNTTPFTGKALTITAASGAISATAPVTLDVKAELLVIIPKGVNIGTSAQPNLTAFGAQSIPTVFVAPGTKVTFLNQDSINHEIHSDGTLGIQHEGGPLLANEANSYTQTFNGTGTYNFRCHIHPNMKGQIVVQ